MARLVVVSNRVAVPKSGTRAGGLEVAVMAALKRFPGIWFGWSGRISHHKELETRVHGGDDKISYVVTDLPKEDYDEYYNGFANAVLWPILHYRLDLAQYSRRDLSGYMRVNERFADELHKILQPDDIVWVHDYHLFPLAKALRDRGHRNKIGFFLHTPFPPPEIITALPQHERIVYALSHYDLTGFQTEIDAANFARYVETECRFPGDRERGYDTGQHILRIGAFPVGIEVDSFSRMARRAARSSFVTGVLESLSQRALIIGVDRLDYSKGINYRLEAFERFLRANPEWHNNVTFLQITPKSRSLIEGYAEMERLVSGIVGRINGDMGEAAWTPIRYVNRAHTRTALAGLYRAARAALVTPLRDGMNLVAKEYVAAQDPDDPGVLILSRFAGAAIEFKPALLVNPYDPDAVAASILRALSMPLAERRARQAALMQILAKSDIRDWPERFLERLTEPLAGRQHGNDEPHPLLSSPAWPEGEAERRPPLYLGETSAMTDIGRKIWAIPEGYIPSQSVSQERALLSHETACLLNATARDAHVKLTVFFASRDPVTYDVTVPARRTLHLRFNDLKDPPIPLDTDYASVFESDVPIVVQHTRLDSRRAEIALLSTIAYAQD